MDLRHTALGDTQDGADLGKRQALVVVQRQDQLLALGQAPKLDAHQPFHFALFDQCCRRVRNIAGERTRQLFRDVLQPLAQERVTLEVASYAAGRASLVDLVDAHSALADAILETLDREATVAADGVRLNLLFGNTDL